MIEVRPSAADSAISRFDEPNYVVFNKSSLYAKPQLVVFLPGTNGRPANYSVLLKNVASIGYRVIGLEYNDVPAVVQVCRQMTTPSCSETFRAERSFGGVSAVVENSQAESISSRLFKLLSYLEISDPSGRWDKFLDGNQPNWSKIVISGFSQGAGMAAFIAKRKKVARVVLFAGPWDSDESNVLARWISASSLTPRSKWFACYHEQDRSAALIAHSYLALQIPTNNIRIAHSESLQEGQPKSMNFHATIVRSSEFTSIWRELFASTSTESWLRTTLLAPIAKSEVIG